MARVLTNVYLPPAAGHTLRTFGAYLPGGPDPAWRAEKERRDLADILPLIPAAEKPDALIISTPEYLPLPCDIASFPGVKILLITDWNVCLRYLPDLCPLFDFCFTDWPGYRLLRKAGIGNVHHQPLFGHDPETFAWRSGPRNLDVSFCGNLNAGLHRERNRLLARLGRWGTDRALHLGQAFGPAYVDVLNRSRLVFNYSVRGEANMRLYEAMACGAVPLVEASNQEAGILFQEGSHYFRYEPDTLEKTLDALLADPARIEAASGEARKAVARHSKSEQIRALLDTAGRESASGPSTPSISYVTPAAASLKAVVKLRVLGAAYAMPETLAELQARSGGLPGLDAETVPASLLSLIEDHPGEVLASADRMLGLMLDEGDRPEPIGAYFRTRLCSLRGRWDEALDASRHCLESLQALENGPARTPGAEALRDLYAHFYPPVRLGMGLNTDLNRAFRQDLAGGSWQGYLDLMRALCLAERSRILLALARPGEALECADRIPADRFAFLDPHALQAEACRRLGDEGRLRSIYREWFRERPLDTAVWDKLVEGYGRMGDNAALVGFLEEILVLSRRFLDADQAERVRALLERRRA
ncbi:MAG: hypothetical protein JWO30_946 [Fibrobacteres bacterium]|nr:hypothetical protein [Fibrobacterota bacterium]